MEYAMKSLSLLYPKRVSVRTSVVTQQLLSEPSPKAPRARPCRVSTADRSVRKGIMAYSLEDLLLKVRAPCALHSPAVRRAAPQGQGLIPHPDLSEDTAVKAQALGSFPQ
uniref:Cell death inducing DFFA like effector c n=1 Tax=Nomascus leucogenys TaxID=61853 RepID=A0A2I3GR42_NOMLE